MTEYITRFAPSPTGPLHLGHAYSALIADARAKQRGGTFLLRIEDIDNQRSKPEWERQIYQDLTWLGLTWPTPILRQSDRLPAYHAALDNLWAKGVLYPCTCRRKDIQMAASAPQEGAEPAYGPDGLIYPGTCRSRMPRTGPRPTSDVLRLDMAQALTRLQQSTFAYHETSTGTEQTFSAQDLMDTVGDIVLSRRDFPGSYHLSVVLDDATQSVTEVVRGSDLQDATKIHVVLQHLLGLPTPSYFHHRLIRDDAGKRLAKRDDARALSKFRADGAAPADIRTMVGL